MEVRRYETIILFDPMLSESELKGELGKVKGIIEQAPGGVAQITPMGKRELGTPVKKHKYASFVLYNYTSTDSGLVDRLTKNLTLNEKVLKFHTVRDFGKKRKYKGNPIALAKAQAEGYTPDDDDTDTDE
jgi:ribosomal protein S6